MLPMNLPAGMILLSACLALASTANAELFRAYLASDGNDANPCTLPQPCRLLPAALAAIQNDGEVWLLDSANYSSGPVTIGKAATILAVAGASASFKDGLEISTDEVVTLRNLTFGSGSTAIMVTRATQVNVDDCRFWYRLHGITVAPGNTYVRVTNSTFEYNFDGAIVADPGTTVSLSNSHITGGMGIRVFGGGAGAVRTVLQVTRSTITKVSAGILLNGNAGTTLAFVHDSEISGTGGLRASNSWPADVAGPTVITVSGSMLSNNSPAVYAGGFGARVVLNGNTISGNVVGYEIAVAGTIESAGNNVIRDNGSNTGALSTFGLQ